MSEADPLTGVEGQVWRAVCVGSAWKLGVCVIAFTSPLEKVERSEREGREGAFLVRGPLAWLIKKRGK